MNSLINKLIKEGHLKSDLVIEAFSEIDRVDFLPDDLASERLADVAFPIGYGQTISQPTTVAIMLELLDVRPGQNVLEVGSGSGWVATLLCHIVGRGGRVTALEKIEELMEWGRQNADKYGYLKDGQEGVAEFFQRDGNKGFSKFAPYDRILVSAAADVVPEALKKQLKENGRMVIPVKNSLWLLKKDESGEFQQEIYPGFSFVPLVRS